METVTWSEWVSDGKTCSFVIKSIVPQTSE